jgi:hypothetical protein
MCGKMTDGAEVSIDNAQEKYERSLQSLSTAARNEWDARLSIRSIENQHT